jgi:prepilin-type N-terminal cleavage/methylation domain-containing protein
MSEYNEPLEMSAQNGDGERDRGMTLIELLVSMMVLGTIITVLAASLMVVWRQQPETQARADVARWEQALALWLPDDLSSASDVRAEPGDTCPSVDCSFGSNALWLSWNDGSGETIVSYRYGPSPDGETYVLKRVHCVGGSCTSHTVLGDLAAPLDDEGNPMLWNPGVDPVPEDVIRVTVPLQVGATSTDGDTDGDDLRAKRVIVSVNGAPGLGGVDRSSIVSFTAGGSGIGDLPTPSFAGPRFLEANSGCGGPVTLVVDTSGSIGTAIGSVRDGIRSFVNEFEGTPTRLQVVLFSSTASVLGASGWNKFYDLSEPSEVTDILDEIDEDNIYADGGTNWEDAMFRTFFAPNGQDYDTYDDPTAPAPELVVFFTDGEPTFDRKSRYSGDDLYTGNSDTVADNPTGKWRYTDISPSYTRNGMELSPRAWRRAANVVDHVVGGNVRLMGVGVGQAFSDTWYPYGDDRSRVPYSGWPSQSIPHEVFLGDLVAQGNPSGHPGGASGNYNMVEYNDGWGDVKEADLLVTDDFDNFGSALSQIALAECGGSLTVQTRTGSGATSDATVTYEVDKKTVTTNRIAKSGTFDIAIEGVASNTVDLVPQNLSGSGIGATGWSCRAGGADVPGAWSLLEAGNPAAGISVTVTANQAMSCTMQVTS